MTRNISSTVTCDRCSVWLTVCGTLATQDWYPSNEGWASFPRPDSFSNWDLCPGCHGAYKDALAASQVAFFNKMPTSFGGT